MQVLTPGALVPNPAQPELGCALPRPPAASLEQCLLESHSQWQTLSLGFLEASAQLEQSCSLLPAAEENKSFQGLGEEELPVPPPFPETRVKSTRSFSHHRAFIYLFPRWVMALLRLLFRS